MNVNVIRVVIIIWLANWRRFDVVNPFLCCAVDIFAYAKLFLKNSISRNMNTICWFCVCSTAPLDTKSSKTNLWWEEYFLSLTACVRARARVVGVFIRQTHARVNSIGALRSGETRGFDHQLPIIPSSYVDISYLLLQSVSYDLKDDNLKPACFARFVEGFENFLVGC